MNELILYFDVVYSILFNHIMYHKMHWLSNKKK